jgi:hypothetical protein
MEPPMGLLTVAVPVQDPEQIIFVFESEKVITVFPEIVKVAVVVQPMASEMVTV